MASPWFDDIFVRMLAPKYRLVYTNIWIDEQNINFNTSLLYIATYNEICLRAHSTAHSFCSLTQYSILFLALMIFPDFSSAHSDCASVNYTLLYLDVGTKYTLCHNIVRKKYNKISQNTLYHK